MIHEYCFFITELKDHGATLKYCDNAYRPNGNIPLKSCDGCKDYIDIEEAEKIIYRYLEERKIK